MVYNEVDHEWFGLTWEDGGFALCISKLTPEKNLELVRALKDAPYPVVFHGSYKPSFAYSKEYVEWLRSLNSRNFRIEVHRNGDEIRRLLRRASLFLHLRSDEGFPLPPLEEMACNKVVLTHDSVGTPGCVDDVGFLLSDDEEEWRAKVNEIMGSDSLRKELGKKAYEYSKQFTWDKTAREVEDALESIIIR